MNPEQQAELERLRREHAAQLEGLQREQRDLRARLKEAQVAVPVTAGPALVAKPAPAPPPTTASGRQARRDPYPALMRIKHDAILPNRFRADVRECFLVAAGYGDLASERAYPRTEAITCIREDGGARRGRAVGTSSRRQPVAAPMPRFPSGRCGHDR